MSIADLAVVPVAMAVTVILVGLVRVVPSGRQGPAELGASIALGLEFLLAAGLLRLASLGTINAAGVVAATIGLRRLLAVGIRYAVRAVGTDRQLTAPRA